MFIFIFLGYVYISILIRGQGLRGLLGVVDVPGLEVDRSWNGLGLEFI
jgi:hypothetical protein